MSGGSNPIPNSPYLEPSRYFASDEKGITDQVVDERRSNSFYTPVPRAKTLKKQVGQ